MKNSRHYIYQSLMVFILLFSAAYASAQNKNLKFTNGEETEIQGNATIDVLTGDITVQPVGNKVIIDADAVNNGNAILGFYPDKYFTSPNSSVTVNWSVSLADQPNKCVATDDGNSSWSGNKSSAPGNHSEVITVNSLPTTLGLECDNLSSGTVYQEFEIKLASTGGTTPNPLINSFTLNSQSGTVTINDNGTFPIAWTTTNATSCTATSQPTQSGWNGSVATSGNNNVQITGEPTLTLTCGSATRQINVNNNYGVNNPPQGCTAGQGNPPNLAAEYFVYTAQNYGNQAAPEGSGFGNPFGDPSNTSSKMNLVLDTNHYAIISDMTMPNSSTFRRRIDFIGSPGYPYPVKGTYSVSKCPGDFNPNTAACTGQVDAVGGIIKISTNPNDPANWCLLEQNKTYHLNFVYSSDYQSPPQCQNNVAECALFFGEGVF